MFSKLLKITGFLVLMVFIAGTLAFTSNESKKAVCRNIEIDFRSNEAIKVNKDEIIRLVNSADNQLMGKKMNEINAEIIEKEIEKHQAIQKADVYKIIAKDSGSYKGILAVKIKHRVPVVRIMSSAGSYYLDEFGDKIPISANYTANVLVVTGYFNQEFAKSKLLPFILFIDENEFWKAQIEQVHVDNKSNVVLIPLVGDHTIEIGELDNYQEKLRNMKAFYVQVLANNNWNKYKSVSLKYKNQVIAKKR